MNEVTIDSFLAYTFGIIVYFVGVVFVFMLAEMIFNTALYAYASEGSVAPGYSQQLLDGAIRTK